MGDPNPAINTCCDWNARYLPCAHLLAQNMDEGRVPELDPACGYEYDVFAVCGDSVKRWTEEHLLQKVIADTWGFKIYRDDFDCALGVPKAEQWCDAITRSRKVILCLTDDFSLDEWNDFITLRTHADNPAFKYRKILPIKLTPGGCLPRYLDGIMNYLDWPRLRRNERDQKCFWQNIRRSLLEGRNTVSRPLSPNGSPPPQPPQPPPRQSRVHESETSVHFVSQSAVAAKPEANLPAENKEPSHNQPVEVEEPSTLSSQTEVKQLVSFDDDSTEPELNLAGTPPTVSETSLEDTPPVVSLLSTQAPSHLENLADHQQTDSQTPVVSLHTDPDQSRHPEYRGVMQDAQEAQNRFVSESGPGVLSQVSRESVETILRNNPVNQDQNQTDEDLVYLVPRPRFSAPGSENLADPQQTDLQTPVVSLHTDPDESRPPEYRGVMQDAQQAQNRFVSESGPGVLSQVSRESVETIPRNNPVNQDQNQTDEELVYYSGPSQTLEGVSYEFYVNECKSVTQWKEVPPVNYIRAPAQHDEELHYNQKMQFIAIFFLSVILASLYNWLWSLA